MNKETELYRRTETEELFYTVAFNGHYLDEVLVDAFPKKSPDGYYRFTNDIDKALTWRHRSKAINIVIDIRTNRRYEHLTAELIPIIVHKEIHYSIVPDRKPENTERTFHNFIREIVYYYKHNHGRELTNKLYMDYGSTLYGISKFIHTDIGESIDGMFKSVRKELRYLFLFQKDIPLVVLSTSRKGDTLASVASRYILYGKIQL